MIKITKHKSEARIGCDLRGYTNHEEFENAGAKRLIKKLKGAGGKDHLRTC